MFWSNFDGVLKFAQSLNRSLRDNFLIISSAVCCRNDIVFNLNASTTVRNIILSHFILGALLVRWKSCQDVVFTAHLVAF
jgi:hypothetical protein